MNSARRRRTRAFRVWLEQLLYDEQTKAIARIFHVPLRVMGAPRSTR